MVTIGMLWLPILVSTVLVFIASSLIWSVLRTHRNDWSKLPDEAALAETLNAQGATPGEYQFPYSNDPADWKDEAYLEKLKRGPVGLMTLLPPGTPNMGKRLAQWTVYILVIEIFVAYLSSRCLPAGADYLEVFQIAGTAAILAFAGTAAPESIWMGRSWRNSLKWIADGVLYGLLSAGAFGWLWP